MGIDMGQAGEGRLLWVPSPLSGNPSALTSALHLLCGASNRYDDVPNEERCTSRCRGRLPRT